MGFTIITEWQSGQDGNINFVLFIAKAIAYQIHSYYSLLAWLIIIVNNFYLLTDKRYIQEGER
jgi:hypothetical protein